jgi:AI-2 transport protein TqsA
VSDETVETGKRSELLRGLAAAVIVAAGIKLGAPILVPLAFALFFAVLIEPLFRALIARGAPVGLAVSASVLVLLTGFALFGILLLGSLSELRDAAPRYYQTLEDRASYTVDWWHSKGIAVEEWVPPRWRDPESVSKVVGSMARITAKLLSETTIVLLVLVFLLYEAAVLPLKLTRLPPRIREGLERFGHVSSELQRYLVIKTAMSTAVGVATGAWVAMLDVDFAVLCGLAAFACHFVPNVGALLAAGPAMVIAFVQFDLMKAGAVGVGYLVIGIGLGSIVEPALLGRRLGLSPLVVFVSLVVWGWLWGPVGMFLSVPLTMALRILLASSPEWRWLAELLGASPPAPLPTESQPSTEGAAATSGGS